MRRFRWLVVVVLAAVGVYLYPSAVLAPMGRYLVLEDSAAKSDCLFVLAGDFQGSRIMKSAELFRAGMAPKVFVSGPPGIYGQSEDMLAIAYAKANGAADVPFIGLPNAGQSTMREATDVYPRLREAGCQSILVVTSNFHTRRAGRILRRVWPEVTVRMVAAPTIDYDPENWWKDRNYKKTFFFEWTKTVSNWLGV